MQKKLGPAWKAKAGRVPAGYYTRRTAEQWLQEKLVGLRTGTDPGSIRTGVTFKDAADEWLRHGEHERGLKPSTIRGYTSSVNAQLVPAFGSLRLEDVTGPAIERWPGQRIASQKLGRREAVKLTTILHGILERARRVYGLPRNPSNV